MRLVEGLEDVLPFQVVCGAFEHEWTFGQSHFAGDRDSTDDPPTRIREPIDTILIDQFLGVYEPSARRITIYLKAVDAVAGAIRARAEDIRFVVRLHEWAHALAHLGLTREERERILNDESLWVGHLARATEWMLGLDHELKEWIAQLTVHEALRLLRRGATRPRSEAIDRISKTFQELTRRAPREYHIDNFVDKAPTRLRPSITLLKQGTVVGAPAWETVMTW